MSLPLPHRYLKQRYEISKHKNREVPPHGREAMTVLDAHTLIPVSFRRLDQNLVGAPVCEDILRWRGI